MITTLPTDFNDNICDTVLPDVNTHNTYMAYTGPYVLLKSI